MAVSRNIKSQLVDRVRAAITRHALIARGDKVIIGVSGGPDSLALLHVLCALRDELQFTIHVAHLNHQLRGDASQADADFVAAIARAWNLDATIESRDVNALAQAEHLSIEEAARNARFAFLAAVAQAQGARVIAVAHNADDQAETVLMHLLRGAGMAGLRGMEFKSQFPISNSQFPVSNLHLIRPLFDVTRAEIEAYVQANGLTPRQDQSNFDTTFFRNRLRHETLPYLETLNPNVRNILRHTANGVRDDYNFLNAAVESAFASIARESDDTIIFSREQWRALHPALQRGTLRAAIQQLRRNLRDVDWAHIENARLIALAKNAGAAATLPRGLMLTVGYADFVIADAARIVPLDHVPLLRAARIALPKQGRVALPDSDWIVETETGNDLAPTALDRWSATFDAAHCTGARYLRARLPQDRFQPAGLNGHSQTLRKYMIDAKIPRALRERLPLLIVGEQIAWVCGWRVDVRARVTDTTREFWRVTFRTQ